MADRSSSGQFLKPLIELLIIAPLFLVGGSVLGQSAGMIPQLREKNGINMEEATWIASTPSIGLCIAALLTGPLSDQFGRIRLCQVSYFFVGFGYAIMLAAENFFLLAFGRFLAGLGVGCNVPGFIHISETSPPAYRGLFLSVNQLLASLGILYMYAVGGYLPWKISAITACLTSFLGLVPLLFSYESPMWLIRKNRMNAAQKSLQHIDSSTNLDAKLKNLQNIAETQPKSRFTINNFAQPTVWKPFLMIFVMSLLQNGSGIHIVIYYGGNFLKEFGTVNDPLKTTLLIGIVRTIGTVISCYLQRHMRRKLIGAVSGFSSAFLLLAIYAYLYFENSVPFLHQNSWIPIWLFILAVLAISAGIFPLPLNMPFEVFPPEVRDTMCGFTIFVLFAVMFFTLKLYYFLINKLRIDGMIMMFAVCSGLFGVFSVTVLVETHEKTLEEIEGVFRGVKKWRGEVRGGKDVVRGLLPLTVSETIRTQN